MKMHKRLLSTAILSIGGLSTGTFYVLHAFDSPGLISSHEATGSESGTPANNMSAEQLESLIQNAKTSADHQKLAAYYTAEAEQLSKESKKHDGYAKAYANRVLWGKMGVPAELAPHCRKIAALNAEAANEARQMAAMHDDVAKKLANQQ